MIKEMIRDTTQVFDHVMCPKRAAAPIHSAGRCRKAGNFASFSPMRPASPRLLERLCELSKEDFITRLMQNSLLSYEQAEAVLYFQMNGCLAINKRMLKNNCRDWSRIQQAIDQFIRAGLESYLIRDGRQSDQIVNHSEK